MSTARPTAEIRTSGGLSADGERRGILRGPREGRPGPDGPAGVSAAVAIGPAATARPSPLGVRGAAASGAVVREIVG